MGRHRREYPTGKLRLKYPKDGYDKNKAYTLYYEYTWLDAAPIRKDTGIRVRVDDWNEKGSSGKGELRASYGRDAQRQNNLLHGKLSHYDTCLQEYSQKHPHQMTLGVIKGILNDKPLTRKDGGKDFVQYVLDNLKSKYTRNKIGKSRYENGISCMNGFEQFLKAKKKGTYNNNSALYLGDISLALIDDYIQYRRDKNNSDATINHALTPIINACERAKDEGLIEGSVYAQIKDCRVEETPNLDNEIYDGKDLTKEQLNKLVEFYNNDTEPRRKEYIEMFLFAFHAGGLRLVDTLTLMWSNINFEKKELKKILIKTAKGNKPRHTIPLSNAAIKILERWKAKNRRKKFVFDLVSDDFDINDQELLYRTRNSCNAKINQALDVVGEKMGLPFKLHFHLARHSFAVRALNDGMSLSVVSRMLGHSSTDITEQVYSEYTQTSLEKELSKLNYSFLPDFQEI